MVGIKNLHRAFFASLALVVWFLSAFTLLEAKELPVGSINIPNVPVITQDGKPVRFYKDLIKDKVVAINFIYTSCELSCPLSGFYFGQLHDSLGSRAGKDVYLISITIDPVKDTPERLKEWSQAFGVGAGWTQVTGAKTDIDALLKSLQAFSPDISDHSTFVLLGHERIGDWKRLDGISSSVVLHTELEKWLNN